MKRSLTQHEDMIDRPNFLDLSPIEARDNCVNISILVTATFALPATTMEELARKQRVIMNYVSQAPTSPEELHLIAYRFELEEQRINGSYVPNEHDDRLLDAFTFEGEYLIAGDTAKRRCAAGRYPGTPPAVTTH